MHAKDATLNEDDLFLALTKPNHEQMITIISNAIGFKYFKFADYSDNTRAIVAAMLNMNGWTVHDFYNIQ